MNAQMSTIDGAWDLYVALDGVTASRWPSHRWGAASPIPTHSERAEALAKLGYVLAPGATWEWWESSIYPDDPASQVDLIASVKVQPVGGAA